MLKVDPIVGNLINTMLRPHPGTQVLFTTLDTVSNIVHKFTAENLRVSAVGRNNSLCEVMNDSTDSTEFHATHYPDRMLLNTIDRFHISIGIFDYDIDVDENRVAPLSRQDRLMKLRCSRDKPERKVADHIAGIEQLLNATMDGGYFVTVAPKNWLGRDRLFLRWWQTNVAQVAKVDLPAGTVTTRHTVATPGGPFCKSTLYETKEVPVPGQWQLLIWFKPHERTSDFASPNTGSLGEMLDWAAYRYAPFVASLEELSFDAVDKLDATFKKNEWWKCSVQLWRKMLGTNKAHQIIGTAFYSPHKVSEPENIFFFRTKPENKLDIHVREPGFSSGNRFACQVKPTNSKLKLITHNDISRAMLQNLLVSDGIQQDLDTGEVYLPFEHGVLHKPYSQVREELASKIVAAGLSPYITAEDAHVMKQREKWLNRQMTPIDRVVQIEQPDGSIQWENVYSDVGMNATYPEILELWRKRALSMRMNRYLFNFQLDDVIMMAAKQCMFNGNVMGLGKTREHLFAAILRGVSECLIIVPKKLIGTWQDEIDNTIVPFARRIRRDWQGKLLQISRANVIEQAVDCLPARRAYFNIISFDKLKSTPRDGRFYKCPECGFVAYSPYHDIPLCPTVKCRRKLESWQNARDRERDKQGRPAVRKHKIDISTGKKVHWNPEHPSRKLIPEEACQVIEVADQGQPPKPQLPMMLEQDTMFKKMKQRQSGWDKMPDGTQMPRYTMEPRKSHVSWTFANILRPQFQYIIVDEILYIKNEDAQRTIAVSHLKGRTRQGATGTPMKGMPSSILGYFNWIFPRQVYPDYRQYNSGGKSLFNERYQERIKVGCVILADGTAEGGTEKPIVKIRNPELFQAEHAPYMLRHVRTEPNVLKDIPMIQQSREEISVDMDASHRAYYQKWLDMFTEWWEKMKEEEEGKKKRGNLLVKIGYLIAASTCPHFMLENITKDKDKDFKKWAQLIGKYDGPPTAKMKKTWELIQLARQANDKVLVASMRSRNLDIGKLWSNKAQIPSMIIDGRVPLDPKAGQARGQRHIEVDKFRTHKYGVMWCGLKALAEGMNIPEANWAIIQDYSWEPSDAMQFIGRMIRPQQTKTVNSRFLMHRGTVDEFMAALCYLKGRSHAEGIDYIEFDDFTVDLIPSWTEYANAVVDGTQSIQREKMWSAVEHIKKQMLEEGEEY